MDGFDKEDHEAEESDEEGYDEGFYFLFVNIVLYCDLPCFL